MQVKAYVLITVIVLAGLLVSDFILIFSNSNDSKDGYLKKVIYPSKVWRSDENILLEFVVHNINCSENDEGEAWFFFMFYINDAVWMDEYNDTTYQCWSCKKGENRTLRYRGGNIRWVIRPVRFNVRVELYWHYGNSSYLMDSVNFTFEVWIKMPLTNVYALGYFIIYSIVCFALFFYDQCENMENLWK
jgi:hypothetical protein